MTIPKKIELRCDKCRSINLHSYLIKEDNIYVFICSKCSSLKEIKVKEEKEERFTPKIIELD